jgi:hypothetical protein
MSVTLSLPQDFFPQVGRMIFQTKSRLDHGDVPHTRTAELTTWVASVDAARCMDVLPLLTPNAWMALAAEEKTQVEALPCWYSIEGTKPPTQG